MNIRNSPLVFSLLLASLAASAQQPASAPPAQPPAAAAADSSSAATQPDRADAYYHFQLGHMYEDMVAGTGRAEFATKAVEEYKLALQADPSSSYLSSALAELYARTGEIREAVAEAENVIARDPDNLDARRLLGRIYLRSIGDLQGGSQADSESMLHLAIEQYERIVHLDPSSIEDHLLLGRLYRLNNETAKAEDEFRTAVKLQPSSEDAVTTLALLYNEEGDSGRALEILQSVPEADRSPRIDSVLGYTYEQKKDYTRAIDAYRKAVDLDRDNLDAVRGLAQNLLNDNQTEAALDQFKTIAAADPQDVQTLMHISEIYRRDGQFEKALETLDKAQAVAEDSMEVQYNRAVIEEALGKYDDAARHLQELLHRTDKANNVYSAAERSNRAIFLERLGTVYRDQNNTEQAVDAFRKMAALGDDAVARAYQQIIETYRDAKDWPAATAAAREAVAKLPDDRGLQMVLAGQEADSGDGDAAIAHVKAMLKGNAADDREVWITLAQMYSRLRRYPDAEKAVAKALELSTKQEEKDYAYFICDPAAARSRDAGRNGAGPARPGRASTSRGGRRYGPGRPSARGARLRGDGGRCEPRDALRRASEGRGGPGSRDGLPTSVLRSNVRRDAVRPCTARAGRPADRAPRGRPGRSHRRVRARASRARTESRGPGGRGR